MKRTIEVALLRVIVNLRAMPHTAPSDLAVLVFAVSVSVGGT